MISISVTVHFFLQQSFHNKDKYDCFSGGRGRYGVQTNTEMQEPGAEWTGECSGKQNPSSEHWDFF